MYPTESTPFIQKSPPRQYSKCLIKAIISLLLPTILLSAVYYYISSMSESKTASFGYNRNNIEVVDEITIILRPRDIYYLESLDRSSAQWADYHTVLIESQGYDPDDSSVIYTFTMKDYHYDEHLIKLEAELIAQELSDDHVGGHDTPQPTPPGGRTSRPSKSPIVVTEKPTRSPRTDRPSKSPAIRGAAARTERPSKAPIVPTPRPTNPKKKTPHPTTDFSFTSRHVSYGGFKCYAKYSLNEKQNTNGHILGCNSNRDTLVGCVGGSTHRVKAKRSGEKAVDHGCIANGESIYIRCCYPEDGSITMSGRVSEITDLNFENYGVNEWCHHTDMDEFDAHFGDINHYMVGCTGWMGTAEGFTYPGGVVTSAKSQTTKMIGTRLRYTSNGESYCDAHRGDKRGFVAAVGIAIGLEGAELDCVLVESTEARQPKNTVINGGEGPEWAAMAFCIAGYSLMDCGGYIDEAIDECGIWDADDKVSAVLFHGTDMKCMPDREQHCSANGNTDRIKVQANCCKIVHPEHEHHGGGGGPNITNTTTATTAHISAVL